MKIATDMPLSTYFDGELVGLERFLDYGERKIEARAKAMTIADFAKMHPACRADVMCEGLEFVRAASEKRRIVCPLYEEAGEESDRRDARLFAFLKEGASDKPSVIVCAGGGYDFVCNIVEGFPVARRFYDLGYNVFVLNYRVGRAPALPIATEDLARAIRLAAELSGQEDYILCGFSAGGNLITQWGTDNLGYASHGIAKPKALLAIYPALMSEALCFDIRHRGFVKKMLGASPDRALRAEYDVFSHAGAFPPTYFAVGRHDLLIDRKPLLAFSKQLLQHGIPSRADVFLHAPHGFGEGTGSGAEGWIELAHAFMRTL